MLDQGAVYRLSGVILWGVGASSSPLGVVGVTMGVWVAEMGAYAGGVNVKQGVGDRWGQMIVPVTVVLVGAVAVRVGWRGLHGQAER